MTVPRHPRHQQVDGGVEVDHEPAPREMRTVPGRQHHAAPGRETIPSRSTSPRAARSPACGTPPPPRSRRSAGCRPRSVPRGPGRRRRTSCPAPPRAAGRWCSCPRPSARSGRCWKERPSLQPSCGPSSCRRPARGRGARERAGLACGPSSRRRPAGGSALPVGVAAARDATPPGDTPRGIGAGRPRTGPADRRRWRGGCVYSTGRRSNPESGARPAAGPPRVHLERRPLAHETIDKTTKHRSPVGLRPREADPGFMTGVRFRLRRVGS